MVKKLMLFAVMAILVAGCKKDGSQVVKINDDLMGKWSIQSNKIVYYDQSGQEEYQEVLSGNSIVEEISFMEGLNANIVTEVGEVLQTRYNLIEENKLIYIELYDAAIFDAHIWKIMESSSKNMTWDVNFSNIKYEDKETGEIVEAPKATLTLKFNKL